MTGSVIKPTLASAKSVKQEAPVPQRVPGAPAPPPTGTPLPFTLNEIRAAVPPHLFVRSALKSSFYLLRDVLGLAVLAFAISAISNSNSVAPVAKLIAWAVYWIFAGSVATGVWVIAHECGHQSFSNSKFLNDSVGWVLHSALLVPVSFKQTKMTGCIFFAVRDLLLCAALCVI
jgi:omega-6 fatty acid desaturase (delta-12 desaturase)